jgi:hypothetical protein
MSTLKAKAHCLPACSRHNPIAITTTIMVKLQTPNVLVRLLALRDTAQDQALLSEECWHRIKHSKTGTVNLRSGQSVETLVKEGDVDVLEPSVSPSLV